MSTPTLTKHTIPGALGDILIDVRAGGRDTPRPAVLVVHGFKGFKDWGMFPPFADRLARGGFSAISVNVSGSGVDDRGDFVFLDRFGNNTFSGELRDVEAVVDALMQERLGVVRPSSLGVVGHSRGGGTAILLTARDARVRALVTWASTSSVDRWTEAELAEWRKQGRLSVANARTGQVLPLYLAVLDDIERHRRDALDIEGAASRISVPWLIVHGTEDETVRIAEGERLRAANHEETTQILRIDGSGHTFGATHPWVQGGLAIERVFDATLSWLATSLA